MFFFFSQITSWICSSWHLLCLCAFCIALFYFFETQCKQISTFYVTFFIFSFAGWYLFLLTFWQTCCFWILFFFPFIFLLNMTPGANTKKNADDITSNDRGEDEGIFCFFFQTLTLMHDFISISLSCSLFFFSISTLFNSPYLKQVHFGVLPYFLLVWKPLSFLTSMTGSRLWQDLERLSLNVE